MEETGAVIEWLPLYSHMTKVETEYFAIEGVVLFYYNIPLEQDLGKIYLN